MQVPKHVAIGGNRMEGYEKAMESQPSSGSKTELMSGYCSGLSQ